MFFAGNRSHAMPLFVSIIVLPLHMLNFETKFSLLHDIQCIYHLCSYEYLRSIDPLFWRPFTYVTPDFLMLETYILINQDRVFDLTCSQFLELSDGIA